MKKLILLSLMMLSALTINAQSSKVVSAYRYLDDYKKNNDQESLDHAKEAIDLASENPDTKDQAKTQVYRGQIYLQLYDNRKRAEEDKLTSIADPNKRAIAALQNTPTTDLETAYEAFSKAKKLDVKGNYSTELKALGNVGIYFDNAGRVNYNAKKYADALTDFEHVYDISGNTDTTALSYAAQSAYLSNNYDKAKTYYQKMADGKIGRGNTYSTLVNIYLTLKDTVGGTEVLKKGRAAYPNDINLLLNETEFYIKTNQSEGALANLNKALVSKPTDPVLYFARGNMYDNLANPKDAKGKDLEKPKDAEDKLKLAESDYKKAIELKPDYFDALFNLGVLYNNRGVAINKKADEIIDLAKNSAENAKATAEFNQAMQILEKALQLNPKDRGTMIALKQIYARLQQTDKLKDITERLKN